jgi:Amt family ammonium transporter
MTLVLLLLTKKLVGLRITEDQENVGLDVSEHDERGYII